MKGGRLQTAIRRFLPCYKSLSDGDGAKEGSGFHIGFGASFIANYLLVTVFLGVPFAFFHGGILAEAVSLVIIAVISWISVGWVLEVMARSQAFCEHKSLSSPTSEIPNFHVSSERKFEIAQMCEMFLGRWAKYACIVQLTISAFIGLLNFSGVVASTISVNLPLNFAGVSQCNGIDFHLHELPSDLSCRNAYRFCLFLFACIVVPLTLLGVKQQVAFQFFTSILRFVIVGALLVFIVVNLISVGEICTCDQPWSQTNNTTTFLIEEDCNVTGTLTNMLFHFRFEAWASSLPLLVVCFSFHPTLPVLSHSIRQKKHLGTLLGVACISFTLLYLLIGVIVPLWWKTCINENCALNWAPLTRPQFSLSLRILSYFIILSPNVYIIAAYPIVVIVTMNNIYAAFTGEDTAQVRSRCRFFVLLMMKLIAAVLPIVVAMFVSNLVTVLKYLGTSEFFQAMFFPALLQLRSQWVCYKTFKQSGYNLRESSTVSNRNNNHTEAEDRSLLIQQPDTTSSVKPSDFYMTPYSNIFSHWPVVVVIGVISVALFVISIVSLFYTGG